MTLAVTKTSGFLFRRSFGFAQDDRLVCQNDTVIPTGVEGSHDAGSD